ncbi:glycosyltransferase [Paracoccus sp. S-4012]|uniref:glycosyltransferase family 4 protein n=1 Tax=Paracoccus sp. S-4012 TaxID=2665648 RepID=UPI0012AF5BB3|nr:glycosyltransferase family 4 protein [Paracoccus sp. S-4012]MRX49332.1 glycosyltransferase [Paracoccus sp. S-4012]
MDPDAVEVIAPNLKRRLSGVTATVVRLLPAQARMIGIVGTGPGLPPGLPHLPLAQVARLPRNRWRVWHARRNSEMAMGLMLRDVLRLPLKLVFTSASQRRHTGYTRALIRRMDAVVATSARSAAYLERPARVIHHGIDTDEFRPDADRAALRARLGLPDGVLVGCYGRIRAQKGTDVFVRAMLALLPSRPAVTALVMGRSTEGHGGFLDGLKAEIAVAGLTDRIRILPEVPVDAMADWYAALDLYVAPQRWEGFGLTPLEAMACGVPVVATRVGAFEELVAGGETGALVPPDDQAAMAAAIAAWLDDPAGREVAGRAARARVENGFRIEDEAAALVALYRELLA